MATPNGDTSTASILDEISSKAPAGTVLPPRNIREIIEKTAGYVARNGAAFEEKIRSTQSSSGKMSFLSPDDAYHAYYRWLAEQLLEKLSGAQRALDAGAFTRSLNVEPLEGMLLIDIEVDDAPPRLSFTEFERRAA